MPTRDIPGLLLVNLGTPDSPDPRAVRTYLKEFLSDPRVLDVPAFERWLVLNLFILPFRPRKSAEAYAKIWTERGSPLLVHGRDLQSKVQARLGDSAVVELAMRYGSPSIPSALERMRARGIDRIVVFPLYPQYSSAATGSSVEAAFACGGKLWNTPCLLVVPPFFDHPAYIEACVVEARPVLDAARPEKVFLSFHGLPERHCTKSDDTGSHCLKRPDCCDSIVAANRNCYRAQCHATARLLARRLDLPPDRCVVCFQSRLGRTPWIRPYTDEVLAEEARKGVRRAAILSPAFVADCIETLEELGIRGVETWKGNGGESLAVVPCVNASDAWADAVVAIARESAAWLGRPASSATTTDRGLHLSESRP